MPLDDVDEDTLNDEVEDYGYFVYDEEVDLEKVIDNEIDRVTKILIQKELKK